MSGTDLFITLPALGDDPDTHIRLHHDTDRVTFSARVPDGDTWRTVATSTVPTNTLRGCLAVTPNGPILQVGIYTVPMTFAMFTTIIAWV